MQKPITLLLLALLAGLASCRRSAGPTVPLPEGDTVRLRHARLLQLIERRHELEAVVLNPWDTTRVLRRYRLARLPLRRAAVFTSVHCALLQELGCANAIAGICELEYIHLPFVHEGVRAGRIADLGNGMSPNIERSMQIAPDALLLTPFENSGGYGRLERLGIPLIECADYMERSPLARAEWIRFYGRLFGRAHQADSLFRSVEQRYLALCRQAATAAHRPRLLCEMPQGGYWYLPGGQSTMGRLYRDAGADYLFSHLPGAGSTPLSIEQVLEQAPTAQVWLIKHGGTLSRQQILRDYPALRCITAPAWHCDIAHNRYYEETPFHPERLLQNLISLLHPDLTLPPSKDYFVPME